jgi:hypothetical protein
MKNHIAPPFFVPGQATAAFRIDAGPDHHRPTPAEGTIHPTQRSSKISISPP